MRGYHIQTEKIGTLSQKMIDLKNAWQSLMQSSHIGEPPDEAVVIRKAISSAKSLSDVYEMNKYLLTKEMCDLVEKLLNKTNKAWHDYFLSRMMREPSTIKKSTELWNNAHKIVNDELPQIISDIQDRFRTIHKIS